VLIGIAGLFILVGAEFLAFVQILVYVGAILTLVIFAIMLTARAQGRQASSSSSHRWPAAAASLALFLLLASVITVVAPGPVPGGQPVTLTRLGRELVTTLVLPFEVISVVFVAAIVGAIAIASSKVPK
jgi:NADH-quinone oxidoreductase subunit J